VDDVPVADEGPGDEFALELGPGESESVIAAADVESFDPRVDRRKGFSGLSSLELDHAVQMPLCALPS